VVQFSTGDSDEDSLFAQRAANYRAFNKGFNHQRFRNSGHHKKRKGSQRIGEGTGTFSRLWMVLAAPTHYIIHAKDLGLPEACVNWKGWFNPAIVSMWKQRLTEVVPGAHWVCLEVGEEGKLHAHVIAEKGLKLKLSKQAVVRINDLTHLENLASYLSKSPLPIDDVVIGYYLVSKDAAKEIDTRLARTSWSNKLPTSKTLAKQTLEGMSNVPSVNSLGSRDAQGRKTEMFVNSLLSKDELDSGGKIATLDVPIQKTDQVRDEGERTITAKPNFYNLSLSSRISSPPYKGKLDIISMNNFMTDRP